MVKLNAEGTQLLFSTYIGGFGADAGSDIVLDAAGNIYITGHTDATDFPTVNAFQPTKGYPWWCGRDCYRDTFVLKPDKDGAMLHFSTYLGGAYDDANTGLALDDCGNVYLTGVTYSVDFPTAHALYDRFRGGERDVYLATLSANGTELLFSTYFGGSGNDGAGEMALDEQANLYLTGSTESPDFPTKNAFQADLGDCVYDPPCADVFVAKLDGAATELLYSSYLGGSYDDFGYTIAVNAAGSAYVTGTTFSYDFPTLNPLHRNSPTVDGFLTKLAPDGSQLVYSTYLRDDWSDGRELFLNSSGSLYITGRSEDAFVAKLNAAGDQWEFIYTFGGTYGDISNSLTVDAQGNIYVTGSTQSTNFPVLYGVQLTNADRCGDPPGRLPCSDVFITKLNPNVDLVHLPLVQYRP